MGWREVAVCNPRARSSSERVASAVPARLVPISAILERPGARRRRAASTSDRLASHTFPQHFELARGLQHPWL